jgi:hypothetical protein
MRQKKENGSKKFIVQRSPKKDRSTNDKKAIFYDSWDAHKHKKTYL